MENDPSCTIANKGHEGICVCSLFGRAVLAVRSGLNTISFLAPLLTRLVLGYAFYQTGKGKVGNLEGIEGFFKELGIPLPYENAVFVSYLEYLGGVCLMIGLATRPVAALLGATMIVALMTADKESFLAALKGSGDKGLTDVVPVVYGLFLAWLLLYGPGLLSLDTLIRKWMEKRGWISAQKS